MLMSISDYARLAALGLAATVSLSASGSAADLNGAWASDASVCGKVFEKKGSAVSFRPDAELYGGGLLVQGNHATGTFQKCTVKSMKNEGDNIHLIAACSTGVMVEELRFTVKVVGDNKITLSSSGSVNTETAYIRCSL
jgi:hypothetical protein